jgi:hypothetical protein
MNDCLSMSILPVANNVNVTIATSYRNNIAQAVTELYTFELNWKLTQQGGNKK